MTHQTTYRGKPLVDMSKDELIAVIEEMWRWAEGIRKDAQAEADVLTARWRRTP